MPPDLPLQSPDRTRRFSRPDASMDLLNTVREEALEPEYLTGSGQRHRPAMMIGILAIVGVLFGLAGASTLRTAPAAAQERADLINRITTAEADLDSLHAQVAELTEENAQLEREQGVLDPVQVAQRASLEVEAATVAVSGPGIRMTLDDGSSAVTGSEVVDDDLRMAVNGMWEAGAEAVAVNGHRVTGQTAIRNAGDAITVNYRSISAPYIIEAIGDTDHLSDTFGSTEGGQWTAALAEHYGITSTMTRENDLELAGVTGQDVSYATPRGQ